MYKNNKNNKNHICQNNKMNNVALICLFINLFYYNNPNVYLLKNYDSNVIIYLQESLKYIFDDIKTKRIKLEDVDYIMNILKNIDIFKNIDYTKNVDYVKNIDHTKNCDFTINTFYANLVNLFHISSINIDIKIRTNVSNTSRYYSFLVTEEKNILDLFNEWKKNNLDKISKNDNFTWPEYFTFFLQKDKNTKINIQKKINISKNDSIIKYYFRSVLCYSYSKCTYYTIIQILSNFYLFDLYETKQLRKIKIKKMEELVKIECIMISYVKIE